MPWWSWLDCWEVNDVAKIYAKRILADLMTLDEVPARWQAQVIMLLEENNDQCE